MKFSTIVKGRINPEMPFHQNHTKNDPYKLNFFFFKIFFIN